MLQALAALLGAAVTVAACYATGAYIIAWCSLKLNRQETFPLAFVLGASCVHLAMFALFALKLAYKPVIIGLPAAVIVSAIVTGVWRRPTERFEPLGMGLKILFTIIFGAFTILYFFHAWAPESSPDGAAYHLGFIARYLRAHGFERIFTNMYASLGQGVELLFAPAFAIGKHSAGALVHFAFTVAVALAIFAYGRRIGRPWAGAVGALLMYASPVVGIDGTSAYIDVGVAAIAFVLFYFLELWDESRNPRLLLPIGLLAGYSFASKYTAFVMVIYALGYVLWRSRRLKPALIVAACATVMIAPWMAKNWIYMHNPVAPFGNRVFRNPYVHVRFEQEYGELMSRYDVKNKWQLPLEVTVRGQKTTGIVGIAFLGAPLALLALRYRAGRRLLVPGVLLGAMYLFNVGTRFLIPCLPFISLAMALALGEVRVLLAMLAIFHALTAWPAGIKKYANQYVWSLDKITYKQALRKIPQEKYLRENYGPYNVARMLDANVPPGQIVFSMNGIPDSYTAREVAVSFQSAWNEVLTDMVYNGFVEDYQPRKAFVFKFPEHLVRRVRVLNTTQCDEAEQWSVHELRFYDRGTELQRLPEWRVTAWPNPWDVQLAFDNSPATRWRSWETASPGMHMDVDFVSAKPIDEVHIDTSRDHQKVKLVIQTQDDAGRWTTLANNSEEIEIKPVGSVRRAATAELRARGVNYLLINDGDFGGQDMRDDPDGWGLEIVSAGWGATLYRVIP